MVDDSEKSQAEFSARMMALEAENANLRVDLAHRFPATPVAVDRSMLQSLIDSSPDMVAVIDSSLQIHLVNKRAVEVLKIEPEAVLGATLEILFPASSQKRQRTFFENYMADPTPTTFDRSHSMWLIGPGVEDLPVEVTLCPWHAPTETLAFVLFRDITAQLRRDAALETALRDASTANKVKSEFLAAASHDIRQPLQTLRLIQGVLAKKVENTEAISLVNDLEITIASMSETLDTLLDLDQLEQGGIEPIISEFPIGPLLRRCEREFSRHARIKGLGLRIVESSAIVRTDRRLLARILQNIISNALKYTDSGKVLIGCRRRGDALRIEIWDTGIGISEHEINRVFEKYYVGEAGQNRWSRGIGLGLTVVHNLAQCLNADITIHSVNGAGTKVGVDLPFAGNDDRAKAERLADASGTLAYRLLIVGRDQMEMNTMRQLLEMEGYVVVVANSANDALARARELRWPDIVIVDDVLPKGIKGIRLVADICRESASLIRGVILAGNTRAADLAEIRDAGMDFIRRPAPPDELLGLISERLSGNHRNLKRKPLSTGLVCIVEQDNAQRNQLAEVLTTAGYRIKEYTNAEHFLEESNDSDVASIFLGLALPGISSLEFIYKLSDQRPNIPIILLAGRNDLRAVAEGMKSGAFDIIEKPIQAPVVLDIVERAMHLSMRMKEEEHDKASYHTRYSSLTARESEIMHHIIAGISNKEVAYRLGISERTVEGHRSRLMRKIGAQTLAELVRIAGTLNIEPIHD